MSRFNERRIRLLKTLGMTSNVSDDGQAATLIFDNLVASIDDASARRSIDLDTAYDVQTVTIAIGLSDIEKPMRFDGRIRGNVDIGKGCSGSLSCLIAGDVIPITLPTKNSQTDFEFPIESLIPAKQDIVFLTLVLRVQRDFSNSQGVAFLEVDSLDGTLHSDAVLYGHKTFVGADIK